MSRLIILSILLAVVTYFNHAGGEKTPIREPSLVKLNMHLSSSPIPKTQSTTSPSGITIKNGTLSLSAIEFTGSPHQETDFHFTTSLHEHYQLHPGNTHLHLLEFDVPAGWYTSASVILHANGRDNLPAFTINALWHKKHHEKTVPLEIHFFDFPQLLSLKVDQPKNKGALLFPKDGYSNMKIMIQPGKLFDKNMIRQLHQAKIQDTPEGQKIILSRDHNARLHAQMAEKVDQSLHVLLNH